MLLLFLLLLRLLLLLLLLLQRIREGLLILLVLLQESGWRETGGHCSLWDCCGAVWKQTLHSTKWREVAPCLDPSRKLGRKAVGKSRKKIRQELPPKERAGITCGKRILKCLKLCGI